MEIIFYFVVAYEINIHYDIQCSQNKIFTFNKIIYINQTLHIVLELSSPSRNKH